LWLAIACVAGLTLLSPPVAAQEPAASRQELLRKWDIDRDGKVDFPQDPDCYAASDTNEGGGAVATGTSDVVGLRQDLGDGRTVRSASTISL
jgi:hypothetical protein